MLDDHNDPDYSDDPDDPDDSDDPDIIGTTLQLFWDHSGIPLSSLHFFSLGFPLSKLTSGVSPVIFTST